MDERQSLITLQRRLQLYDGIVVSIMLYNCDSWAIPKSILNHLDKCHRQHLRSILGIHWPNKISSETPYNRFNTRPLSERVTEAQWRMLGHLLRMPSDTPAQLTLKFAVNDATKYKGRRRPTPDKHPQYR